MCVSLHVCVCVRYVRGLLEIREAEVEALSQSLHQVQALVGGKGAGGDTQTQLGVRHAAPPRAAASHTAPP